MAARVSPSNHQTTAAKLNHAGITLKMTPLQDPLDFDAEWARFAGLCGSTTSSTTAWNTLEQRISSDTYSGELEFDSRLYNSIITLLGGSAVQRVTDSLHLLRNSIPPTSNTNTLRIGIARQVQREKDLGFDADYGLTTDAIHDHAVVLVNQLNDVVDETSLVELKTDASNCCSFPVRRQKVYEANLSKEHGALGQALIYTAGDLVNSLSRRGIVESHLEILVLSGKKRHRTGRRRLCYVRGQLDIPEVCGWQFDFSVVDFESYDDPDAEKHGLAAYFATISNGIERARRGQGVNVHPTPLCGRTPKVANCDIPLNLVGSPIPRVSLEFAVSQGEFFRANLSHVLPAQDQNMRWMIDNKDDLLLEIQQNKTADETVLVKFGCQSVHQSFVPPLVAYQALQTLHSHPRTKAALSSVLLCAWHINSLSLVTITKELTDFGPVKPEELSSQPGEMPKLFSAFIELVGQVLVPMAEIGVVYADMRPGWAETSNVLRKRLHDGASVLKLIDYESVCQVSSVPKDVSKHKTFHRSYDDSVHQTQYTALRHLWWQCVFTAYTWAMRLEIVTGEFDPSTFVEDFRSGDLDGQFWGNDVNRNRVESIVNQETITGQMVVATLHILSQAPGLSN